MMVGTCSGYEASLLYFSAVHEASWPPLVLTLATPLGSLRSGTSGGR
jgi:hypothetical protein